VSAGINALFGPLHGGANQAVLEMLERINSADYDVDTFMAGSRTRRTASASWASGTGSTRTTTRARIIKKTAHEVLDRMGGNDELDIAMRLEEIALADDYFVERKLYPNVDFYTGLIYKAMGFRPGCSPCSSPSAASRAGSPSGAR
jgi:citrate synthase